MTKRPITPQVHGLLDYGLTAANAVVPGMLNMSTKARALFRTFAVIQGGLNAVTDQPLAVQKIVPFPMHGLIDKASAPLYLLAPFLTGVIRERRARNYWLLVGVTLVTVYNLTDWSAPKPGKKRKRR
ncbi:hypothetical protein [Naasia sp. SYSU D00948]|uniref:hypothetical protein n=1 Tax=Naasia sp. SYSU D00948 TaxID=2817379 RepID=UPI001B312EA8|nr:hypothetical protein [Naasia sp. SYSU D00948]